MRTEAKGSEYLVSSCVDQFRLAVVSVALMEEVRHRGLALRFQKTVVIPSVFSAFW